MLHIDTLLGHNDSEVASQGKGTDPNFLCQASSVWVKFSREDEVSIASTSWVACVFLLLISDVLKRIISANCERNISISQALWHQKSKSNDLMSPWKIQCGSKFKILETSGIIKSNLAGKQPLHALGFRWTPKQASVGQRWVGKLSKCTKAKLLSCRLCWFCLYVAETCFPCNHWHMAWNKGWTSWWFQPIRKKIVKLDHLPS